MRATRFSSPELIPLLSSPSWSRCEGLIRAFEEAWQRGEAPAIADYLRGDDPERRALLLELVHIELEFRLKSGEPARIETYLQAYPDLAADRRAVLDLLTAEYEFRRRHTGEVGAQEYRRRFPEYVDEMLARLPAGDTLAPSEKATASAPGEWPRAQDYEIVGELGRGGMGIVYKAREPSLDRHVALKFLPPEYAHDPAWLDRFVREARTASALNHPHICTIHALGRHEGRPFIVMELVEGLTLRAVAARRPGLDEAARLISQVARALAAAHAAGVVHRDIKPDNVMVRADGYVKVLDFGLARRLPTLGTPSERGSSDTDPGAMLGTVAYMSPEQAQGAAVESSSDIFSLRVVLYELVTGRRPFDGDSALGILYAIVTAPPLAPSRLNPEVPAGLEGLIQAMLHKEPTLRPSATEVAEALASAPTTSPRRTPAQAPLRPVVHREAELEVLRGALAQARAGRGSLVCVGGEPGIGKTTLVEDFLTERAETDGPCLVARGRCSERLGGTEAYLPVTTALADLLRRETTGWAARVMKLVAPTWYAEAARDTGPADSGESSRASSQRAMLREFSVLLEEASRRGPVVLFLDDVHWADPSTVDLLAHLGGQLPGLGVLVIATYRPADLLLGQHPFHRVKLELQGKGIGTDIALGFLQRSDVDRYLALDFPGHAFPADFADLIHARTEGSPLFMADLLRYLRERGVLARREGRWVLARELPDLRQELPASVRSVIQRHLERLGEDDRRLLDAASVQGHEFDSATLADVLGLDPALVEERLQVLERVHGLVRRVREDEFPDRTLTLRHAFVHVAYQHALYGALPPTRKATWSAAAAQALLGHYGEQREPIATELALLFETARQPAPAIEYYLTAARHAVRVFAHHEAAELARRGLALLPKLPDGDLREQHELTLLLALGVSLVATQGFASAEVEATYVRAEALARQTGDPATLFPVRYGLWNMYLVRCALPRCRELAAEMFALAQGQADPVYRLMGHNVLQQPMFHVGDLTTAREHQQRGLALYDAQAHRTLTATYGEDPGVGCLAYGAATLWHVGYPEQALRAAEEARRLAGAISDLFNFAQALYFSAYTHLCRREVGRVQDLADALMALCQEHGFPLLLAGGMVLRGKCLTERGQMREGIHQMRQGLADWRATGAVSHRPFQLGLLAEAQARAGAVTEALAGLDEALEICGSTGERFWEPELHRLRGETLLGGEEDPSKRDAAEACFRRALDLARRQNARSLELRTLTSWARMCRQGQPGEARRLLAETYRWFTEGFDTADLQEAGALLEEPA